MIESRHLPSRGRGILCAAVRPPFPALLVLVAVLLGVSGRAVVAAAEQGDPSAAYLQAYIAFQDGSRFEEKGDFREAKRKYEQSLALFDGVKRSFPSWNPRMVDFRTGKVEEALQMLDAGGGAAPVPAGPAASTYPAVAAPVPAPSRVPAPAPTRGLGLADQIQSQIDTYEERIRQLQVANQEIREELESQKQVVQDSVAKIAAAKNQESSALQRIAQLEQELAVARQSDSEALALMEKEQAVLKSELLEASQALEKANEETSRLFTELEESKATADRFQQERDEVIKERDQMAIIVKTFEENSDKALKDLVAENGKLQKELQAALEQVETLTAENEGKDLQIVQLESQVEEVRVELASIREKASGYAATIADLESRLKATMQTLDQDEQSDDVSEELLAENELLRGLIIRQLRHQVRQQQTNQLVRRELEQLEGSSQNLIDRVARLTDERPGLSDAERELLEKYDLAPAEEGGVGVTMVARVEPSPESSDKAMDGVGPVAPAGAGSPGKAGPVQSPREIAAQAEDAFFTGDFGRAEKLYEDFVKTDPVADKHGIALANLGVVRMRLEKFGPAQQALTKARAIHPDNAFVHFMLGMSYYWQGRNDDALLALENASQLDPMNVKVHQYIGVAAARLGEFERAEEGFLEAIALDPRYAPAHFNLAVIYATGDGESEIYDRAEQHYLRAVEVGAERDPLIERILNEAKAVAGEDGIEGVSG